MTKTKAFSLASTFSGATTTIEQQKEIERLREEVEKLRSGNNASLEEQLEKLRQELKQQSGEHLINIERMKPSAQPRQTFNQSAIRKRAESLRRHGQKNPIILVPILGEENLFEIEDGELRYRGANLLVDQGLEEWKNLKAVIAPPPLNALELHKRSLIHHLHQEGLNPLDRIEAIIKEILTTINFSIFPQALEDSNKDEQLAARLQIQQSIRRLDYFFKKNQDERLNLLQWLESSHQKQLLEVERLLLPSIDKQILLSLLELQQNVCSLAANDLPMLSLPDDLKEAIRTQELPCHQAKAISKLSSKVLKISEDELIKLRSQIVQKVITESLSLRETKETIARIISEQESEIQQSIAQKGSEEVAQLTPQSRLNNLTKKLNKSRVWQSHPQEWKKIDSRLRYIENVLFELESSEPELEIKEI
jgi:ParB family transcriptional regulator, chromosome partitioning protein